jgi:pimeloyl-[acyl-carrier protein] methyl ester esterase
MHRVHDYSALELRARAALPFHVPFVLLGESFSGPIALAIAASPPPNLRALVLSTTSARTPLMWAAPLAPLARFAPAHALPMRLLSWALLGRWGSDPLLAKLRNALLSVDANVLRARAAAALRVDVAPLLSRVVVPTLILQARQDRLLSARCSLELAAIKGARLDVVDGPHLLLQAQPTACAELIANFAVDV